MIAVASIIFGRLNAPGPRDARIFLLHRPTIPAPVVLVPDTTEGHTVTLSSSPRRIELAHQPAKVIARVALQK